MSISGRKRASLVLLLVLAAGLVLAGAAAAGNAQEMACCPAGMESGCTWLGAGDCCPERPVAQARSFGATPSAAACGVLTLPAVSSLPLVSPPRAVLREPAARRLILRL